MTCILAATDLSTRSDRAVQRALRLSAKLKLPCRIVSVVDNDMPDCPPEAVPFRRSIGVRAG